MDVARSCSLCENNWNNAEHQPVALPACGHTFCRLCLVKMYRMHGHIKCPLCRKDHDGARPRDLPANFALLSLIDVDKQDVPQKNYVDSPDSKSPKDQNGSGGASPAKKTGGASPAKKTNGLAKGLMIGCAAVAGGVGLVAAVPVVLTAVGFTSVGIAASSFAASMMSSAAIANGGGIAAGSLVAVLQSAGAAGIGTAATVGFGAAGAVAGAAAGAGVAKVVDMASSSDDNELDTSSKKDKNEKDEHGDDKN